MAFHTHATSISLAYLINLSHLSLQSVDHKGDLYAAPLEEKAEGELTESFSWKPPPILTSFDEEDTAQNAEETIMVPCLGTDGM